MLDIDIMRHRYEKTLKQWRLAFFETIATMQTRFHKCLICMWEFYFAGCEYFFRSQTGMVFQLQLSHNCEIAPVGRRYIAQKEGSHQDIL